MISNSSPLIDWYNSIPQEMSFDDSIEETSVYGQLDMHFENNQKGINKLIRRIILELVKKYDPKITRHTLKHIKVRSITSMPLTLIKLYSPSDDYARKYRLCIKQKFMEISNEQK